MFSRLNTKHLFCNNKNENKVVNEDNNKVKLKTNKSDPNLHESEISYHNSYMNDRYFDRHLQMTHIHDNISDKYKHFLFKTNKLDANVKCDFDDVLIVPQISSLNSRKDVDLIANYYFHHSKREWSGIPIMISNMDTTGTIEMAREAQKYKIITCLHKFYEPEDIPSDLDKQYFAVSSGTRHIDIERLHKMMEIINPHFVCIDIANGYSSHLLLVIEQLRKMYPKTTLIAGNVVTPEMANLFYEKGVDIIKMGIGSGSVCTTRLETGVGYPQFSCIFDTRMQIQNPKVHLISDGGIKYIGDISKAFGAGADFVMLGGMFSGHEECSGDVIYENEIPYKVFYGMSSSKAMITHYGKVEDYRVPEGKCVKIKYKGKVENTIKSILGGIRSTMTYVGINKIDLFYDKCRFIRVNHIKNDIYDNHLQIK